MTWKRASPVLPAEHLFGFAEIVFVNLKENHHKALKSNGQFCVLKFHGFEDVEHQRHGAKGTGRLGEERKVVMEGTGHEV